MNTRDFSKSPEAAAAHRIADFAVNLKYEEIPPEVLERAKDCVIDTVAACVFGAQMPWTQAVIEYAPSPAVYRLHLTFCVVYPL